ncbi:MAG: biopolymer transporter ExbD [Deltaproteobacteria bacterium]|nr:biopolymer transporter ExbD [Deltaproteobacteria bacterium]
MAGKIGFGMDNDERDDLAEINIIPLVDIMLVLLITFMIAAPLSIRGINVNLPTSKAKGQHVDGDKVILSIDRNGKYFLEKVPISAQELPNKIQAIYATKKEKNLYIRADKNVAYGTVVDAMGIAKLAGVDKIAMLTTPPPKG